MAAKEYDVLIVGSGHAGGMAGYILAKAGVSCLMLNAGPVPDLTRDRALKPAYELPYHGFGRPGAARQNEFTANAFVDDAEVPYTHDPKKPFRWTRVRLVGGRSLFWSRMSFRLSDYEFKAGEVDGTGDSWPITHADLAPYYSRVEQIYRISGRKEGWPQFPDGDFIDTTFPPDSESIKRVTALANERGMKVSKVRSAVGINGLASSLNLSLPEAVATGNLTVVPNAVVREVTVDKKTGLANGVNFVDRHSRREMHAKARVVVVGAGALESTRLLLNSGIANSSGVLGHYLHDQIYGVNVVAAVPQARDGKAPAGLMGGNAFLPRFRNLSRNEKRGFIKGYCVLLNSGATPATNLFAAYGRELQEKVDSYAGACVTGGIYGERVPRFENHVRINRNVNDAWGIPVLEVDIKDGENEYAMAKDGANVIEELFHAAGWDILVKSDRFGPPGASIHELGTCRMGDNPKTSVLNKWCQSHDIRNLFVVDAASFVTCGWQNPTETILALSMRASEYLMEQMRQRNL